MHSTNYLVDGQLTLTSLYSHGNGAVTHRPGGLRLLCRMALHRLLALAAATCVLAALTSCNRAYVSDDATSVQRLAVLPYEVTYTGRIPPRQTAADLEARAAEESLAYQRDLIDQIGRRLTRGTRRRSLTVGLQAATETLARLRAAGVEPRRAYLLPADSLTRVLGVDAVAVASVSQQRVLTEAESTLATAASVLLGGTGAGATVAGFNRTFHVDLSMSIVDAAGTLVYNDESRVEIAAGQTLPEAIARVNRRVVDDLPYYRKRKRG